MHGEHRRIKFLFAFVINLFIVSALAGSAVAAIVYESTTNANTGNATLSIPAPSNIEEGDLLIANFCQDGYSGNGPSCDGWTELSSVDLWPGDPNKQPKRGSVLYKVAGASDEITTAYQFTISGTTDGEVDEFIGFISRFSGVDTTTPFDAVGTHQVTPCYTLYVTAPGITTVTNNAMVLFLVQQGDEDPFYDFGWQTTNLGSLSEIFDQYQRDSVGLGAAIAIMPSAGATGDGSAMFGDGTDPNPTAQPPTNAGILVALREAPSTPTSIPTLSEWGMIIFALLMAGTAFVVIRRRHISA